MAGGALAADNGRYFCKGDALRFRLSEQKQESDTEEGSVHKLIIVDHATYGLVKRYNHRYVGKGLIDGVFEIKCGGVGARHAKIFHPIIYRSMVIYIF